MKNLQEMKGKKHFRTFVILLAGMLLLSTAVYANYDSANGYSNGKAALKYLALKADDFTGQAEARLSIDGKTFIKTGYDVERAGKAMNTRNYSYYYDEDGELRDSDDRYYYEDGSMYYSYDPNSNSYYGWESNGVSGKGFLGADEIVPGSSEAKAVRFVELLADTLVGDLKNNVVMTGENDGIKHYSVSLSKGQVPEFVNAGLSFVFTASNNSLYDYDNNMVTYEDYNQSIRDYVYAHYDEETAKAVCAYYMGWYDSEAQALRFGGKTEVTIPMTQEEYDAMMDVYNRDNEAWQKLDEIYNEACNYYESILQDEYDGKGVLEIRADGSMEHYDTYAEYKKANSYDYYEDNIMMLLGDDPYVEEAILNFSLDKEGRLVDVAASGTLSGRDREGEKHSFTMDIDAAFSDYGCTVPAAFDPSGKQDMSQVW